MQSFIEQSFNQLKCSTSLNKWNYQHALLNFTVDFYFYAFLIAIPVSLIRVIDTNWQIVNFFHIAVLFILVFLHCYKNKLSYSFKIKTLITIFYAISVMANYNLGLASGNYLYFATCVLLSATFLSLKRTITLLCLIIVTQLLFMVLTNHGVISFHISPITQVNSLHFWTTNITAFITVIATPLIAIGWLNSCLKSSQDALQANNLKLQMAQEELVTLSQTDELTSLPNRRALFTFLAREFNKFKRKGTGFTALMLDLDYFKKVNDKYGHDAGDQVLKSVAQVLQTEVRDYEIVARTGGEEFIIILLETNQQVCLTVAERIRKAIEDSSVDYQNTSIKITASIGLSQAKENDNSFEAVLKRADLNVYSAKHDGRNRVNSNK